jgi:hypothetical protein
VGEARSAHLGEGIIGVCTTDVLGDIIIDVVLGVDALLGDTNPGVIATDAMGSILSGGTDAMGSVLSGGTTFRGTFLGLEPLSQEPSKRVPFAPVIDPPLDTSAQIGFGEYAKEVASIMLPMLL